MGFNAEDFINEMLSQSNFLPPDLQVDDREIPEAKNVIEFLHEDQFLGNMLPSKLFPRQAELLIKLNAEYCPHCTDLDYFESKEEGKPSNVPVNESFDRFFDHVQLLEYGICPKCGASKSSLFREGSLIPKTEGVLLLGQRSGKSAVTSMQESYSIHKFLKVPNLQRTYNLLPSSPFVIPLVAMSFEKAKQLIYNALYEYLTKGNWYKMYHSFLDDIQASRGMKEELYAVKDTFTRYRHKNILIAPFGPDKRKLRGNTSIGAACLTGDTWINSNKGFVQIKDLLEGKIINKPEGYQTYSDGRMVDILGVAYTGEKECIKIILENGRTITCSLDHKFITPDGGKQAKDLKFLDILYYVEDTDKTYTSKEVRIVEILKAGIQPVYNLTVDSESHTYFANGIWLKNCDEIGWMIAGQEGGIKFDADEIYNSINNSLMTAKESYLKLLQQGFNDLPAPINLNISSPSSKKDKICRLYEDSKRDQFMFGMHLATWEVNPQLPFDGPTMTALRKKNEKDFWRDFGAVPPNSANSFFPDISLLLQAMNGKSNLCKIKKQRHLLAGKEYLYGTLSILQNESQKPNRILAIDAGAVNNSFAFSIAHLENQGDRSKVVFDTFMEIIPEDDCPLDFSKIYENIIEPLIKNMNIKMVCTDRWQNLKILSDIANNKALHCKTMQYSVRYGNFVDFRQAFMDQSISIPKAEIKGDDIERAGNDSYPRGFEGKPISHFIFQAITVVDMAGKSVTKGENVTDDIFRSAVLAYSIIVREDMKSLFKGFSFGSGGNTGGLGARPSGFGMGGGTLAAIPTSPFNPFNR